MKNENSDPSKFIYFILDEFIRFGKMSYLLEAPALCRSYRLKHWLYYTLGLKKNILIL